MLLQAHTQAAAAKSLPAAPARAAGDASVATSAVARARKKPRTKR